MSPAAFRAVRSIRIPERTKNKSWMGGVKPLTCLKTFLFPLTLMYTAPMTMQASRGEMSRAEHIPVMARSIPATRTSRCWLERFSPTSQWRSHPASAPTTRARRL